MVTRPAPAKKLGRPGSTRPPPTKHFDNPSPTDQPPTKQSTTQVPQPIFDDIFLKSVHILSNMFQCSGIFRFVSAEVIPRTSPRQKHRQRCSHGPAGPVPEKNIDDPSPLDTPLASARLVVRRERLHRRLLRARLAAKGISAWTWALPTSISPPSTAQTRSRSFVAICSIFTSFNPISLAEPLFLVRPSARLCIRNHASQMKPWETQLVCHLRKVQRQSHG